jgi:hypothetical protein
MDASFKTQDQYYNYPNNFKVDGEDHVNIIIQSTTKLGRLLDPRYIKVINYPNIGKFSSVSSLWAWLQCKEPNDSVRKLVGNGLREFSRSRENKNRIVPNLKSIIAYATWLKLKEYPELIKAHIDVAPQLPVLSYYVVKSNNLRICSSYAHIIIPSLQEIFKAIQEDTEPNFSYLNDRNNTSELCYLKSYLEQRLSKEELQLLLVKEKIEEETEYELTEPDIETV